MSALRFLVYSDYLCPWCYNAAVRLRRLEERHAGAIELEWRAYLLRPEAKRGRDLARFRAYTESWLRPAQDADGGRFRVWQSDEGPPTHSIPPHVAARAARALGKQAFDRLHLRLLDAYFWENRDISHSDVLEELWQQQGLPVASLRAALEDAELSDEVVAEFEQAVAQGVTGIPAVQLEGNDAVIVGAHPESLYERWIERSLARQSAD